MSEHFITNKKGEKSLADILNGILPNKAKSLDFLVGYFYFSGMTEIYKNIADKNMRVLVGLEMEKELLNKTAQQDYIQQNRTSSRQQIRANFNDSLVNIFNQSDYFEGDEKEEAFKIYYEKIKNGTLEIRKTFEPCHAKMYIFSYGEEYNEGGELPGTVITGSSNLTYSGLRGQNEINVRFNSKSEHKDACGIFEELWDKAIVIADKDHVTEFEDGVIKHIWYEKKPTPYLMYLRVLHEYFSFDTSKRIRSPHEITNGKFFNLKYQEDAVRLAIDTLSKHNGVIVSDVVGLGKSIIGSAVAHNMNLRTIVIAPPHLVPQWDDYRTEFGFNAKVFSNGKIESALDHYKSLTSRDEKWLIIIDEAHNYRNEYTRDYALLHELCQGNKVVLLTATPFNNHPADIYSMVKLFQIPTKSTLQTVENLSESFTKLINDYKILKKVQKEKTIDLAAQKREVDRIANKIRGIISPLVIRRSRIDLDKIEAYKADLKLQKIAFPEVEPPEILEYKLGDLRCLYQRTLERISPRDLDDEGKSSVDFFKATRYQPVSYVLPEHEKDFQSEVEAAGFEYNLFKGTQRNLSKFMRTLLVRRFESSQKAFHVSLENMRKNCENILIWAEKRQSIPIFKKGQLPDIESIIDSTNDMFPEFVEDSIDSAITKFKEKGLFEIKLKYLKETFVTDLQKDITILKAIEADWKDNAHHGDPKLKEFQEIIAHKLKTDKNRKLIVFSEFADTVNYVGEQLKAAGLPVFLYTSAESSATNKDIIRANFDAGLPETKQRNDYQVLVATDAISEGYNLHCAGSIFNYDIPYNPTRVIQRVGRINRINKKVFDTLYIFNYFPTDIGEAETRGREISTLKMDMIHAIMGEDTRILSSDEQLKSYFHEEYKKLFDSNESESWDTKYKQLLNSLQGTEDLKNALMLPMRSRVRRETHLPRKGVLVFAKKGNDFVFKIGITETLIVDLTPMEALSLIQTTPEEVAFDISKQFNTVFDEVKKSLFVHINKGDTEKSKREALDKVRAVMQSRACEMEYLEDLVTAIEMDGISGFALRQINRLKTAEYSHLPNKISRDYLKKILNTSDGITRGKETLILAEEIVSDSVVDTDENGQFNLDL